MTSDIINAANGATITVRGHTRGLQIVVSSEFGTGAAILTPTELLEFRDALNSHIDALEAPELEHGRKYFSGVAIGEFEGILDYVDLRGSLPAIKLANMIGGSQIDCVCRNVDVEKIRQALKKRAVVTGRAIYDGSGPLPRRVEVFDIKLRNPADDFSRWKGSITNFERVQIGEIDGV